MSTPPARPKGGRRTRWRRRAGVLALVPLLVLSGCGDDAVDTPDRSEGTEEGSRAPALEGTDSAGEPFALHDESGRATVIVFHQGVSCGLCRLRFQQLQTHLEAYQNLNARVIAVTPDAPEQSAAAVEQLGLEYSLVSVDSATLARWSIIGPERPRPLPATYIVDRAGVVRYRAVGRNAGDLVTDAALLTELARMPEELAAMLTPES